METLKKSSKKPTIENGKLDRRSKVRITVDLTEKEHKALKIHAATKGVTSSTIIRRLLRKYCNQ